MVPQSDDAGPPGPSHRTLAEAAEWFALLQSGEAAAADRGRWQDWLAASSEHRLAWSQVERISRRFEPIRTSPDPGIAAASYRRSTASRARRRQLNLGLVVVGGIGLVSAAGWTTSRHEALATLPRRWRADHRSGTSDIREVVLSDGTRVWLNALSAFDEDYRPDHRRLQLQAGEILITTAADALGRPFLVETVHGRLQAIGTRFSVRVDADRSLVAVQDGAIEIRPTGSSRVRVPAGRQVSFNTDGPIEATVADPGREAWIHGVLVAQDLPLSEVVETLGRHFQGHVSIAPNVAGLRVFGSYPLRDPVRALTMLESVLPIRIHRPLPWWIGIEAREEAGRQR